MSERRTKVLHLSTEGCIGYENFDAGVKELNACMKYLKKMCERNEGYSAIAIGGVSENSKENGRFELGYRNERVFVPDKGSKIKYMPVHIHLCILANPGETIAQNLVKYFTKKHGSKILWCKPLKNEMHLINMGPYILYQSRKYRTVKIRIDTFTDDEIFRFCSSFNTADISRNGDGNLFKIDFENKNFL